MRTAITILTIVSILAHRIDRSGNIRVSLWDGEGFRSGVVLNGSDPFRWYRAHVSRDSIAMFAESDAETVRVEFQGDTILKIR